jgi:subtilisin family serine protease
MKLRSGNMNKLINSKTFIFSVSTPVFIVLLISGKSLSQPISPLFHSTGPNAELFDDSIIVKYKESILDSNVPSKRQARMNKIATTLLAQHGVRAIRSLPRFGIQLFRLGPGQHLDVVISALRNNPNIEYAEYNFRIIGEQSPPPPKDPTDPQWITGSFWGLRKIGMRSAWGYHTDASNIIVAVIDSGIDYTHPDLAPNMYTDSFGEHGYNFCDENADPKDTTEHGTAVAGVIGATGDNNYGGVGTDWKVRLVALKAICILEDKIPIGGVFQAEAALEWAMAIGAHIINNSWRLDPKLTPSQLQNQINILEGAVRQTNCEGPAIVTPCVPALFVAAAGNGRTGEPLNNDPCTGASTNCGAKVFPANFGATPYNISNVISVAATECTDSPSCFTTPLWSNSHYGSQTVHIAAPGVNIFSTVLWKPAQPWLSYSAGEGTSMATPHVSGCAALLQARKLAISGILLSITQLKDLLFNNAETPFVGKIMNGRSLSCAKAMAAM